MPERVEAEVSKLEGLPLAEQGKFAQAYEYTPPEDELLGKRGRLFVVLDITADPAFDAALAGKLIWDSLTEEYFSETEEPPLKALERAVLTVKNRLASLTHPLGEGEATPVKLEAKGEVRLNLAAAVVWGELPAGEAGVLYLARQGEPTIFLKRAGQVRGLLTGKEPNDIASVVVEDGDVVILGSHAFGKSFTPTTLPEVSFLEKEFKSGRQVPGLAAIVLKLKVLKETPRPSSGQAEAAEEEMATEPFVPKRGLKLPSVAGILKRLPRKRESLPFPSDGVKGGVEKLVQRVTEGLKARIARGREIYLERKRPEIGLPKVIVALVFIFLLSVVFTLWQQQRRVRAEEFVRLLSSAEATMDEARDMIDFSNEQAKELWSEAKEELERAAAINSKDEELIALSQRAENLFNRIEKITPVTEEHLFYDLTLQPLGLAQGEQVQGLSLTGRGKTIYVAEEKTESTLAIKGVPSGIPQVEEATANGIKGARQLAVGNEFLYLLTTESFHRYNLKTGKKDNPLTFSHYGKVVAFDLYLGRNVYFLVPSKNQIYKFLDLGGSYSRALDWLEESLVLEEAIDLTIDGSVWVLTKSGTVLKFLGGEKESFSFKNLPSPVTDPKAIYTRPNFKRLYVGDGDRVAVFEKGGRFVKQFKGEVLTDLVDLWVTDDEKTLFFLTKSKIFKISL